MTPIDFLKIAVHKKIIRAHNNTRDHKRGLDHIDTMKRGVQNNGK